MNTKDSSFSLQRVGLLIKWHFADKLCRTRQFVIMIVLFSIFYTSRTQLNYDFSTIVLLVGFLFASSQFTFFVQPLLATNYFLIPVSTLERTVTAFILSSIYYLLIFIFGYVMVLLLNQLSVGTHTPINWDFMTFKGMQVHSSIHMTYNYISIWSLTGKILFIQAIVILSQFLVKKNVMSTLISIPILFLVINPDLLKSLFDSSIIDSPDVTHGLSTVGKSTTTFMYLLLATIIWRINYSVLSNKQV
jgi:hypothetical protein